MLVYLLDVICILATGHIGLFVFSFHDFTEKKRKKKKRKEKEKVQLGVGDDGGVLIALIYGGWIHQLELDVGGNIPILCLQMVIDLA